MVSTALAEPQVTIPSTTYNTGAVVNEWAQYTLDTYGNVTVKSGANVIFGAGGTIKLTNGFKVEPGGVFKARVSALPDYNPGGYYTGITPSLALVGGDQQYGQTGQFNLLPLDIAVWNQAGTAPLAGAPVLVTVSYGGGWIAETNGSGAVLVRTLHLTTDVDGTVRVYYQQGATESVTSSILVIAGGQTWQFTSHSYAAGGTNPDTDNDGIFDSVEDALGLHTTQPTQITTVLGLSVFTP